MKNNIEYCSAFNPDASETVAYNNPLFPAYIRYGILSNYPDYSAISHWHRDLEFISVKKGQMTYNVNGRLIVLSENHGIMVNSRQLHYGFSKEHNECEFICILLSPELLAGNEWFYQNCVEHIIENAALPYLYLDSSGWQNTILEKLDTLYRNFSAPQIEDLSYFELMEEFISILKLLYKNLPAKTPAKPGESSELAALKNMLRYIEEHFANRITLADIASAGACCKSKCSFLFKKYLRDTPITYATKFRLKKSLAALLDSETNITDIAYAYGFGGASYYCEIFQKYYGISPSRYRKTHTL